MKASTVNRIVEWAFRICVAAIVAAVVYAFVGCSSTQYVPVADVHTDSSYFSRIRQDSIFIRDSVYVKEKGDTVFQWKYKYVYKVVTERDTAFIERADTVYVPYPVETKLTWWQQKKQDLGEALTGIVFVGMLYYIIMWIVKRTRKKA